MCIGEELSSGFGIDEESTESVRGVCVGVRGVCICVSSE